MFTEVTPVGTVNTPFVPIPLPGFVPASEVSSSVAVVVVNPAEKENGENVMSLSYQEVYKDNTFCF